MTHTPGPWYYGESKGGKWFAYGPDNRPLVVPNISGTGRPLKEIQSNLRMLALSLELLEALKGLLYLTDQERECGLILSRADGRPLTNGDQDVIDRAYLAAEKAHAKAEAK